MTGGYQILDFSDLPPIEWTTSVIVPQYNFVTLQSEYNETNNIKNPRSVIIEYTKRICDLYDNRLDKPILVKGLKIIPIYTGEGEYPLFEGKMLPFYAENFKKVYHPISNIGVETYDEYFLNCDAYVSLGTTGIFSNNVNGFLISNISVRRKKVKEDKESDEHYIDYKNRFTISLNTQNRG